MATFREWLEETFGNKAESSITFTPHQIEMLLENAQEFVYNRYAQAIVAELYGSMLSRCDFNTYVKGEKVEKDVWYRLNVEPNPNQSSSEFMKQLARRLVFNGEALIIKTDNGNLYIASQYRKSDRQLVETWFDNVWVDVYEDNSTPALQLQGKFYGENAIYITYHNANVRQYINQMNNLYEELINNVRDVGSSATKYKLKVDTGAMNGVDVDWQSELEKILNEDFKALVSKKHALVPLLNGFDIDVLNASNNNAENSAVASNNVNNMFEDIKVNVGNIYNVPKSFMLGTFEKNDMDEFLTFGLDPLCSLIGECVNRKYYGKKQILEKTYCELDTKKVKHFDILTVSDAINKLISSGVYTINEIRQILGETLIDSEIGDKHWITRNYAVVGDYIQEMTNFTGNDPKTHPNGQNNNGGNQ